MFKKVLALTLSTLLVSQSTFMAFNKSYASPAALPLSPTDITAESAILMDADSGQILFDKNGSKAQFPASTTKILTALIIAESNKMDDKVVIDKDSPHSDGSRIYVIEGEEFTVRQLLHALLLESANDTAVALAKFHSGTVAQFAKKMNQRAKELGCTSSNFQNPNGLPDPNHLTSAKDLALIAREVMKHPELMEIVKMTKSDIPPTNKQPATRHLFNSNRFLSGTGAKNRIVYKNQTIDIKYDIITGMKTGYTNAAQQCFVVTASKDGKNLIAVILKSQGNFLYIDPRTMIDYGLENFKSYEFATAGQLMKTIELQGGKKAKVNLYTADVLKGLIPINTDPATIQKEIRVQPNIQLPIKENQVLGEITLTLNGQIITRTNLVNLTNISNQSTIGADTTHYFDWLKIDKSPLGLTVLGFKCLVAIALWRFIVGKIYPKRKRKKKPRPKSQANGKNVPRQQPQAGPQIYSRPRPQTPPQRKR